ncbi:unnamed protein product [Rhizophagus irregularis]|nr:unnamed protein product [Rhizophagus irregularis]
MVTASSSLINIFYNHFILVAGHGRIQNYPAFHYGAYVYINLMSCIIQKKNICIKEIDSTKMRNEDQDEGEKKVE